MGVAFVDTSAWVALAFRRDQYHKEASRHYADMRKQAILSVTSDYILDETLTILRSRGLNMESLSKFFKSVQEAKELGKMRILFVDEIVFYKAWNIFETYADKDYSFTDCTSFVIAERLKVDYSFTFDKHFKTYGLSTRPL